VRKSAEELSSAIEEINRAASQIQVAIQQIERGAETSRQRADQALVRGEAITTLIAESRSIVDTMIKGAADSVQSNTRLRDQVTALVQVAGRIDKIIDAISTVGIQTNMLAVNGSIDAARAGEFGKASSTAQQQAQGAEELATAVEDIATLADELQAGMTRRPAASSSTMASPSASWSIGWPMSSPSRPIRSKGRKASRGRSPRICSKA
jgi:methyl-accepting chemotaxis protein